MALSVNRSQFEQDWRFHGAVFDRLRAKAERYSAGKWDLDCWDRTLVPIEFDTFLVLNFIGVWENNGRFVDSIGMYENYFDYLDRAFRRLGFNVASVLMPPALELVAIQDPYYKNDLPLPPDIKAEVERINQAAAEDVSEGRLTAAIESHAAEYAV